MTFEQEVVRWILISLGVFLYTGIVYKFFFKPEPPIIIKPVPRKVEVRK